MEVRPQKEVDNPQDIKMFAVERHGLPEHFVLFVLCVESNRHHSYLCRVVRLSGVRYSGRHR